MPPLSRRVRNLLPGRRRRAGRIFFAAMARNHIRMFSGAAAELVARGRDVTFCTIAKYRRTVEALTELGFPPVTLKRGLEMARPGDVAVIAVDWGPMQSQFVESFKAKGVRAVGQIETVQYGKEGWYNLIEEALVWGPGDVAAFGVPCHVVGYPVIERTLACQKGRPQGRRALINYKFTYSDSRSDPEHLWYEEAVGACEAAGLDLVISGHPANLAIPLDRRFTLTPVEELFNETSLLISRSSTVVVEALVSGLEAVLYPIEGEELAAFAEPLGAYDIAFNEEDLRRFVARHAETGGDPDRARRFLDAHVSIDPERPSHLRVADAVEEIARRVGG